MKREAIIDNKEQEEPNQHPASALKSKCNSWTPEREHEAADKDDRAVKYAIGSKT
jgi:hypothetical protein